MIKNKELNFFSKETLIDITITCIIGIILHFAYEFSGKNILVALFSAVNNSIWNHIKIIIFSIYIVSLVKMYITPKREKNLWTALFFKIITAIIAMLMLYNLYIFLFMVHNLIVDICIFYIAITLASIAQKIILNKVNVSPVVEDVYKYINLALIILTIIFSIYPLNLNVFRDILNNKLRI